MPRSAVPPLSPIGHQALDRYATALWAEADLSPVSVRNYLSDLRQFAAWCEATWADGREAAPPFAPAAIATPTLTRYRGYLQRDLGLKPASINRALVSLKRYTAWAVEAGLLTRDPAKPVKLVPAIDPLPRHLEDDDEEALLAAVTAHGTPRDRTIITLLLHTGLRVRELCGLRREHVHLGKRSGHLAVIGKRDKYREVPLNATVRAAVAEYLRVLPPETAILFPSAKTGGSLTERALGYLIKKYARRANVSDVHPHDLRHRFGYRMAERVPLHRLAQIMGHDSLDTTMLYSRGTPRDLQRAVETIAWE